MALRTLAIAFLVLAFSRPTLHADASWMGGGNWSVVVVVDPSLSMVQRSDHGAYIDQARVKARAVIASLDHADEVSVGAPGLAYRQGRDGAEDLINALDVAEATHTVSSELRRAGSYLEEHAAHVNRRVYFLGDLQRSTLVDSVNAVMPAGIPVVLLPLTGAVGDNLTVSHAFITSRIVEHRQPVKLVAVVHNYGADEVRERLVSLFLEERRVAQASVDVPAFGSARVEMTMTPQQQGWIAGSVSIEDDVFPPDNTRYFTVFVPQTRRVLISVGAGASVQFVQAALSSQLERGTLPTEYEMMDGTLPAQAALARYDVVLLLGKPALSSGERSTLVRYVESGGGLLLFPMASGSMEDYDELFLQLGGGTTGGVIRAADGTSLTAQFNHTSLQHPVFEGMFADASRSVESIEVHRMVRYIPRGSAETTVIPLSNGDPLLQEIRKGRGTVFAFAVAPDLSWSNLPLRGLFVPLLYRSIQYLSGGGALEGEMLVVGQPASVTVPSTGSPLHMVAPDGRDAVPRQRELYGMAVLDMDGMLSRQGVFDIRSNEIVVRRVGVNVDAREPDLRPAEAGEAASILAASLQTRVRVDTTSPSGVLLEAGPAGVELWKLLLVLAIVCLVGELVASSIVRPQSANE